MDHHKTVTPLPPRGAPPGCRCPKRPESGAQSVCILGIASRCNEAIVVRLAGTGGPDGNRLNARELYQSRRLNPPWPLNPLIIEVQYDHIIP
jgi:hypothetical protein